MDFLEHFCDSFRIVLPMKTFGRLGCHKKLLQPPLLMIFFLDPGHAGELYALEAT